MTVREKKTSIRIIVQRSVVGIRGYQRCHYLITPREKVRSRDQVIEELPPVPQWSDKLRMNSKAWERIRWADIKILLSWRTICGKCLESLPDSTPASIEPFCFVCLIYFLGILLELGKRPNFYESLTWKKDFFS